MAAEMFASYEHVFAVNDTGCITYCNTTCTRTAVRFDFSKHSYHCCRVAMLLTGAKYIVLHYVVGA